jgi:hypothetical protein
VCVCDIFTDRMTDKVTDKIIQLVMLSVIFNLWPGRPTPLLPHFLFFMQQTNIPNLRTTQPLTTNSATTTLSLSASVLWFKFYWGFSTLSKQIYLLFYLNSILKCWLFLHIFLYYMYFVYVFTCFIVFSHTNLLYRFMICTG